jgi:hypothetical protein
MTTVMAAHIAHKVNQETCKVKTWLQSRKESKALSIKEEVKSVTRSGKWKKESKRVS